MGTYDTQQVCLNGHQATDSYHRSPQHRRSFCKTCGAPTIHQCPACKTEIRGDYDVPGVWSAQAAPVPSHCEQCGKPYPWAKSEPQHDRSAIWALIHPAITLESQRRFESGEYADSAEAALKTVNARVKRLWKA